MPPCRQQRNVSTWMFAVATALFALNSLHADPVLYEPGVDPGVGFNLVSWDNFGNGAQVWENAVQAAYDAGFDEVSLSPVRFFTPGTGSIASTSSSGPELNHIAAGVARAKQLGMRVTVNPFVEPDGFSGWRGTYNPTPNSGEWTTFWSDYQQYLVDVATMAQANGADSMTVGTELRALELNTGNNAKWSSVINAVDGVFTGSLGYASNWDSYASINTTNTIWENPAIDYIGIDSYFTGLLSQGQADNSGSYPNIGFITQVEDAWNSKLDNEILPFAAARKGGTGMPVEFTEIGYLPYDHTSVTPQGESQPLDQDEQNMAFEGFMRALDGRKAAGEFLAAHIWQWDMPGSGGSLWNMNPNGGNQPNNQQTAQWLSSFMQGTNPDPGEPPDPPPPGATQVLYSFESGLQGFFYPNFEASEPASTLTQLNGAGNTDGDYSLRITKPTATWTWDARVQMGGDQLQALQNALADNDEDYVLELDISYVAGEFPGGFNGMDMHLSMESNLDSWTQLDPFAAISGPSTQTIHVEVPLSGFDLTPGLSSANFHIGFRDTSSGSWSGSSTIYVDRIALTDLTFVPPENANFDGDDDVDGDDFLVWQRGYGMTEGASPSDGDANGDGAVNELDLAIWEEQYGLPVPLVASATAVPESATFLSALLATGLCLSVRQRRLG